MALFISSALARGVQVGVREAVEGRRPFRAQGAQPGGGRHGYGYGVGSVSAQSGTHVPSGDRRTVQESTWRAQAWSQLLVGGELVPGQVPEDGLRVAS